MPGISKKEADAYDRVLEAAGELADLIESAGIQIDEDSLEELTIFLAYNAAKIKEILKPVKGRGRLR